MSESILHQIAARRRERIRDQGHEMGVTLPASRTVATVPFGVDPFLICEVKRRSPSRGAIAPGRDAVEQARVYAAAGVRSISVLTEQDRFDGSLQDLVRIKEALPRVSVLRKDFLLDVEDVEVSWRAGADAVLLIAALLDASALEAMHAAARRLGMSALVELHDLADVEKCRSFAPELIGINCRDLRTFRVDMLDPVALLPRVSWKTRSVFESGVRAAEDVRLARSAGFDGVLVGETAMREPGVVPELAQALRAPRGGFWPTLWGRRRTPAGASGPARPLVKICGITRAQDAEAACGLGADALGFVFAPSKRRADPAVLRQLRDLAVAKVAVVVTEKGPAGRALPPEVVELREAGLLDAVQLHGDEEPAECAALSFPYYKALRIRDSSDVQRAGAYRSPRVLADAWSAASAGGTGQRVPADLVRALKEAGPLWLAGGLSADNVGEIVRVFGPELIDASSGLEQEPGKKDLARMKRYFDEIARQEGTG